MAPPPEIAPPRGWRIERHLASGGTAHVFLVTRGTGDGAGMPAILKWGRWRERDIVARFELEAAVLRTVGPAWTPALHDHGVIDGWPYLIMELIAGETLAAWMSRAGDRGGLGEILALLDQIAAGLAAIHAAGIVHRDLKPENVLIGSRGVRLIDFGLAKQPFGGALTQIGAVVGTVHYLAPEQIRGATVDHRADIYSYGVVAFEMLCGGPPFIGERRAIEYQHTVCRPPSVREWRAVPDELHQLVTACLAKQPEARPQSAAELRAWISRAAAGAATARGVAPRPLGVRGRVALVWTSGADPLAVVHAVGEVGGLVVRRRGDGVLAAFTGLDHDNPLAAAVAAAQALAVVPGETRASIVLHLGTALLRRSVQGKVTAYGDDVEHCERWLPPSPCAGILVTAAAAELAQEPSRPAPDVPGFFRIGERGGAGSARAAPPLIGRSNLIESLAAIATQALVDARPVHIAISGASGAGKTRVLDAVCERLRAAGHAVIAVRGLRRFAGELADDPVDDALGGGDLAAAIDELAARGALVAIDDAMWIPAATLGALDRALARAGAKLAVVTASAAPVGDRDAIHRVDVVLPPLAFSDAEVLVRELLRPARLIPRVLVERLAIRANGSPGLLVALAGEITRRGAVRKHVGSDEWYVAADELDTLLAAPSQAWFAVRTLEDLPAELWSVVRVCAGLGARFSADELAAVLGDPGVVDRLARLVQAGVLRESGGWYAFADAGVQDALYGHGDHGLDERATVHSRAFVYWLARPDVGALARLARLAYHGPGADEAVTATACCLALARAARDRGEPDVAEELLDRALGGALCSALGSALGSGPGGALGLPRTAPRLSATALVERAQARARDGQRDEAAAMLQLGAALAEALGDRDTTREAGHALALITSSDSDP